MASVSGLRIFGFTEKTGMTNHLYAHTAIFLQSCRDRAELGQPALWISLDKTGEEHLRMTDSLSSEDQVRKAICRIINVNVER